LAFKLKEVVAKLYTEAGTTGKAVEISRVAAIDRLNCAWFTTESNSKMRWILAVTLALCAGPTAIAQQPS